MLKTQSGKRQREKLKNARATARSAFTGPQGHIREVVEEPGHDFRMKGAVGKGSLLDTVFHVREAGYEVDKRIIASREPLVRTSTSTEADSYYNELIPIPVRPNWDIRMKPAEVATLEDEEFENYLQKIYDAYPPYRLNHFEHNLHVWKQLWKVVEISDILILCADARHPLFHVPPSLYNYIVHEAKKPMICVLNKIDFISSSNLAAWIADFKQRFPLLTVVPFSSFPHEKTITNPEADIKQEKKRKAIQHEKNKAGKKDAPPPYGIENLLRVLEEVYKKKVDRESAMRERVEEQHKKQQAINPNWRPTRVKNKKAAFAKAREENEEFAKEVVKNVDIMAAVKSIDLEVDVAKAAVEWQSKQQQTPSADSEKLYSSTATPAAVDEPTSATATTEAAAKENETKVAEDEQEEEEEEEEEGAAGSSANAASSSGATKLTVGMIGHPNVGKSSLINALFGRPVVTVSETPGKTKHLQTLTLNDHMEVCDCPGLVFPAVDMPRALQVLCGIFPISQLREPYSSVQYLASRIEIEKIYGLVPPTVEGVLDSAGIDTSLASSAASVDMKAGGKKKDKKKAAMSGDSDLEEEGDMFAELQIQEATEKVKAYVWSAWDICESYAKARSYSIKGSKGLYDTQRAANDILHDALSGVILLTFCPTKRDVPLGVPASVLASSSSSSSK